MHRYYFNFLYLNFCVSILSLKGQKRAEVFVGDPCSVLVGLTFADSKVSVWFVWRSLGTVIKLSAEGVFDKWRRWLTYGVETAKREARGPAGAIHGS